ncbi:PREDICTED: uncharacterized protein LOC108767622 [Trachymyrmex cornetzi]|uniref:uncharacterized protein LOC108767622 n=1 Tax=Trachymyrmex cornetzi TaxID=471704 RepID=UPI00084F7E74|nr:PREDICTED: uncharacterized protein LOC108767622 [Trachymyrmex cornetzi]
MGMEGEGGGREDTGEIFKIGLRETQAQTAKRGQTRPPRWSLKQLDEDLLEAAVLAGSWTTTSAEDPEGRTAETQNILVRACDTAMLRATQRPRKTVYWWSDSIASLRGAAMRARREIKRARRRQRDLEEASTRGGQDS